MELEIIVWRSEFIEQVTLSEEVLVPIHVKGHWLEICSIKQSLPRVHQHRLTKYPTKPLITASKLLQISLPG